MFCTRSNLSLEGLKGSRYQVTVASRQRELAVLYLSTLIHWRLYLSSTKTDSRSAYKSLPLTGAVQVASTSPTCALATDPVASPLHQQDIYSISPFFSRQNPRPLAIIEMASSEVDMKFLGQFAKNIQLDHPLLAQNLFQILGNLTMLSKMVIKARKLRRLDTTRDTKSVELYTRIVWYAKEGLKILEQYVLPLVQGFGELKVLIYKLRAGYYHLYVLFHNTPAITLRATKISTPPGLTSPRHRDKGKAIDRSSPADQYRPNSLQPTHPLEGGPEIFSFPPSTTAPSPQCFEDASILADRQLWGSHPLRLSVKVEYTAFIYDCLDQAQRSRDLARKTINEVYNADEGMDDDMFEDAAELVSILGKMVKRGLGVGTTSAGTSTAGGSSEGKSKARSGSKESTPRLLGGTLPPMHNPI
ncbi:hypothetical protein EYC84_003138 [Monilinia fructicola]|uniref:14-3-3 domain-containing protein n=1 Tax=Monilinia fructicola TaxID=38448 RepID=A0A5M9JSQ0_MONFR|nr:hypothetical protein EYC84_003138 [Monilinia fructicola]